LTDDPTGRVFDALSDPNRRYVVEALAQRPTANDSSPKASQRT
jgi:hypothetical protein